MRDGVTAAGQPDRGQLARQGLGGRAGDPFQCLAQGLVEHRGDLLDDVQHLQLVGEPVRRARAVVEREQVVRRSHQVFVRRGHQRRAPLGVTPHEQDVGPHPDEGCGAGVVRADDPREGTAEQAHGSVGGQNLAQQRLVALLGLHDACPRLATPHPADVGPRATAHAPEHQDVGRTPVLGDARGGRRSGLRRRRTGALRRGRTHLETHRHLVARGRAGWDRGCGCVLYRQPPQAPSAEPAV